jgi:hypothetical protein
MGPLSDMRRRWKSAGGPKDIGKSVAPNVRYQGVQRHTPRPLMPKAHTTRRGLSGGKRSPMLSIRVNDTVDQHEPSSLTSPR